MNEHGYLSATAEGGIIRGRLALLRKVSNGLEIRMDEVSPESPEPAIVTESGGVEPDSSGKKVCTACRTVNEPAALYCYKCGVKLPEEIQFGVEAIGPPAGFWIRFVAYLIDRLFLGIIGFVIALIVATFLVDTSVNGTLEFEFTIGPEFMWWTIAMIVALEIVYFTVAVGAWGKTIGKAMLSVKVVRSDGDRVSYGRSLARCLVYLIQLELIMGLPFIIIAFNPEKQGIHDMICDTRVARV
ncbi:MAG TPA: RDD family protein [Dehalococcoidia bacterium]|nr:RDD family protein [Dehalococcoidia bacterium]